MSCWRWATIEYRRRRIGFRRPLKRIDGTVTDRPYRFTFRTREDIEPLPCTGDCNENGDIGIDEIARAAGMALRVDLDDPDAAPRWYTNTVEVDLPAGDVDPGDNVYVDVEVCN